MIDRLREQVDHHERRLDDHLQRLAELRDEADRQARALRRLESDRTATRELVATTRTLAEQTSALAGQVAAGAGQLEALAERAAEKAIANFVRRRAAGRWRLALRLAAVAAGFGAIGSLIAYVVLHG